MPSSPVKSEATVSCGAPLPSSSTAVTSAPGTGASVPPRTTVPTISPTDEPTGIYTPPPTAVNTGGLYLSASPQFVKPMERINLTGQWPGHDAMGLMVQRQEDGEWVDFGVQTTVRVGTFATYILTGRPGDNVFRVYDPETETASNEVTVTIG